MSEYADQPPPKLKEYAQGLGDALFRDLSEEEDSSAPAEPVQLMAATIENIIDTKNVRQLGRVFKVTSKDPASGETEIRWVGEEDVEPPMAQAFLEERARQQREASAASAVHKKASKRKEREGSYSADAKAFKRKKDRKENKPSETSPAPLANQVASRSPSEARRPSHSPVASTSKLPERGSSKRLGSASTDPEQPAKKKQRKPKSVENARPPVVLDLDAMDDDDDLPAAVMTQIDAKPVVEASPSSKAPSKARKKSSQSTQHSNNSVVSHIPDSQPGAESQLLADSSMEEQNADLITSPPGRPRDAATVQPVTADGRRLHPVQVPRVGAFVPEQPAAERPATPPAQRTSQALAGQTTSPIETSSQFPAGNIGSQPPPQLRRTLPPPQHVEGEWAKSQPFGFAATIAARNDSQSSSSGSNQASLGATQAGPSSSAIAGPSNSSDDRQQLAAEVERLKSQVAQLADARAKDQERHKDTQIALEGSRQEVKRLSRSLEGASVPSSPAKPAAPLENFDAAKLTAERIARMAAEQSLAAARSDAKIAAAREDALRKELRESKDANAMHEAAQRDQRERLQREAETGQAHVDAIEKQAKELQQRVTSLEAAVRDEKARVAGLGRQLEVAKKAQSDAEADQLDLAAQLQSLKVQKTNDARKAAEKAAANLASAEDEIQTWREQYRLASQAAEERGRQAKQQAAEIVDLQKKLKLGIKQVQMLSQSVEAQHQKDLHKSQAQLRLAMDQLKPLQMAKERDAQRIVGLELDLAGVRDDYNTLARKYALMSTAPARMNGDAAPFVEPVLEEPRINVLDSIRQGQDDDDDEDEDIDWDGEDSDGSSDDPMDQAVTEDIVEEIIDSSSLEDAFYCQWRMPGGELCAKDCEDIGELMGHVVMHVVDDA